MRIVHLSSVHGPFDTRIFLKQCKSLAQAGYEVSFVVPHHEDVVIEGVSIHGIKRSQSRLARMTQVVLDVYKKASEINGDIYHFHDPELIPIGLALKYKGKKVIYDSHEDYPSDILSKYWIPITLRKIISNLFALLENYSVSKFDAVVTVHKEIQQRFELRQKKVVVLHNYPISQNIEPPENYSRKLVWLGMMNEIRGSKQIDQAMTLCPAAELDIIGPSATNTWNCSRINLLGNFPFEVAQKKASTYRAGLVTYLPEPNHIDALPNKLFEYMALGIPVIASDFPKWRQIVEDAQCGILVDPTSPEALAEAMKWILEHPEETRLMGENGKQAVLQKYSWSAEKAKLLKLYKEISE
ncbi:hypothetical protein AXX12_08295 [Anaerosporomusa subterranea]|uniref:Glycosyl transferase n=1 Tax=Anaerosporomusa subterranea TaxID=1794912 RepID=A0A154BR02_ANASB|nr:glycosyltransferase [Anaerosporomusa subterranea]KYZ76424.1 hypothetical protein AXX12_08295 [Anaerosporomusa subterranea]